LKVELLLAHPTHPTPIISWYGCANNNYTNNQRFRGDMVEYYSGSNGSGWIKVEVKNDEDMFDQSNTYQHNGIIRFIPSDNDFWIVNPDSTLIEADDAERVIG